MFTSQRGDTPDSVESVISINITVEFFWFEYCPLSVPWKSELLLTELSLHVS